VIKKLLKSIMHSKNLAAPHRNITVDGEILFWWIVQMRVCLIWQEWKLHFRWSFYYWIIRKNPN